MLIRLFICDYVVKDIVFDEEKMVYVGRSIMKKKKIFHQVNITEEKVLIDLIREYPKEIIEWYDDLEYYTNDQTQLKLEIIISKYDVDTFIVFTNIFKRTWPYVDIGIKYEMENKIVYATDSKIFNYFIGKLIYNCNYSNFEYYNRFATIISAIYHDGIYDNYYEKYIKLIESIRIIFSENKIKRILDDSYYCFETNTEHYIIRNNYKCAISNLEVLHKYFPSCQIFYGAAILYSIGLNNLEFADLYVKWYKKDSERKSCEPILDKFPITIVDNKDTECNMTLWEEPIKLETLEYFYKLMTKEIKFYSIKLIQSLIFFTMYFKDTYAFIYLTTVFPYEAISMLEDETLIVYPISKFKKYYQKLIELKEDFTTYCKK